MFIGVARFELFIPASESLKDKRRHLRPVLDTVGRKFNVGIAEVDFNDLWQRAAVGITCASGSPGQCAKVLSEVEKVIGRFALEGTEIIDRRIEIRSLQDI
ncbi:hypothetical protein BH18ACT15_BH18ACT15_06290 [soil metagenome]